MLRFPAAALLCRAKSIRVWPPTAAAAADAADEIADAAQRGNPEAGGPVGEERQHQAGPGDGDVAGVEAGRRELDGVVQAQLDLGMLLPERRHPRHQPFLGEVGAQGDGQRAAIAQVAVEAFIKGEVDVVYLVYAKFVNTVTQTPTVVKLLPVEPPADESDEKKNVEYIYEPDPQSLFEALLPRYVDLQVYQALLESLASQWSAQMVAMKNATDSAKDLLQDLNLTYNKARQASITTQILEVVSGAEALG